MGLDLRSPAFDPGENIPTRFTGESEDQSVPLFWSDAPERTKSFALVVDDLDARRPGSTQPGWVHWIVYDIPADESLLTEGASSGMLPPGAREGLNDWRATGWAGPCSAGRHRYRHTIFALDVVLPDLDRPTRDDLDRAMSGHVLETATLIGTYEPRRWRAARTGS